MRIPEFNEHPIYAIAVRRAVPAVRGLVGDVPEQGRLPLELGPLGGGGGGVQLGPRGAYLRTV